MIRHRTSRSLLGAAIALVATSVAAGELTLYADDQFQGERLTLRADAPDLDVTNFNDRAASVVVRDGVWEVCSDSLFRGHCETLQPGRYPSLDGALHGRVSSAREVSGAPGPHGSAPPPSYAAAPGYGGPGYGSAKAILYEGPGFSGRSLVIDRNVVRDLDRTRFNDRARSLRVESGYWIFCSDANFEGDCRTFGPGDYANLPGELSERISSGRMISGRYPYSSPPAWDRG